MRTLAFQVSIYVSAAAVAAGSALPRSRPPGRIYGCGLLALVDSLAIAAIAGRCRVGAQ